MKKSDPVATEYTFEGRAHITILSSKSTIWCLSIPTCSGFYAMGVAETLDAAKKRAEAVAGFMFVQDPR